MGNTPDIVTQLKSSGYGEALSAIQTKLGIPADINFAGIETLLIYMISRVYIKKPDNIDIALLGLGLLNGFNDRRDRSEPSQERDLYTERRESFFQKTDFILKNYKKKYNVSSYEEAKRTVKEVKENREPQMVIDTIRGSFDRATSRCIKQVISSLYEKKDSINDCLQAAQKECEKNAKEKGIKIDWHQCSHLPEELLPNLKYYQRKQIISGISCTVPDLESGIGQENESKTETPSHKTTLNRQEPVPKDVLEVSLESVKNVQMDDVTLTKDAGKSDLSGAAQSDTVQHPPCAVAESKLTDDKHLENSNNTTAQQGCMSINVLDVDQVLNDGPELGSPTSLIKPTLDEQKNKDLLDIGEIAETIEMASGDIAAQHGDGVLEEDNFVNVSGAGQSTRPSKPPGESLPKGLAERLKVWIKKLSNSKVFVAVVIGIILGTIATLIITSSRTSQQQQHQESLELLRELYHMPSGSEIKITESTSFGPEGAIYTKETTVTVQIPGYPDGHSESILGEEFAEPFSEPLG